MLIEGSDKYQELEETIRDSTGAAEAMADTMEDNIGGAFREMWSAITTLSIALGDQLKPHVQDLAEFIGGLAMKFTELDEGTQKFIVQVEQ